MSWQFLHTGEFFSALCGLLFAAGIVLFRKSGELVTPVALNLFKDAVALGLLLITLPAAGVPLVPRDSAVADWITLLISGAVGIGIADSLFFASLNRLGAGRSAIVDCLYSPLVILLSYVFLDSAVGTTLVLSVVLMVVAIMIGAWRPEPAEVEAERWRMRAGVLFGVLSMLGMAAGIVIAKPVLNRSAPLWATAVRLMGGVALLVVQGMTRRNRGDVARAFRPGRLWLITVPAALVGAYGAMVFWVMGMTYAETTTASVLNQLSTIFVLIFATAFLKEPLTARKIVAIALGFAGGVVAVL